MKQHTHLGVYALIQQANKILYIKKARGPYTGKFDLPGGGIEFSESPEETLKRELLEETGLTLKSYKLLDILSHEEQYITSSGNPEHLHHLGIIYKVEVDQPELLTREGDGQDSLGTLWIDIAEVNKDKFSPFAFRSKKHFK